MVFLKRLMRFADGGESFCKELLEMKLNGYVARKLFCNLFNSLGETNDISQVNVITFHGLVTDLLSCYS